MKPRTQILGVEIDPLTMDQAILAVQRLIAEGNPSLVLAVNVDVCMQIQRDVELRKIFASADLVFVDGTPMMWAARFLRRPFPGRVSGSDFLPAFCATAVNNGHAIFFLGGAPGIAEDARDMLQARYPGLRIVGTYAPPVGFDEDESESARIVERVRHARPDVLFVACGCPRQERWLSRYRDQLRVPVSMGVGSAFDYLAGRLRRAPMWMQRAGIEWIYRLVQEPRRLWRRYLIADPPFVYHVIKQRLHEGGLMAPRGRIRA